MDISGQMAMHAALEFSWMRAASRIATAFRPGEPIGRHRDRNGAWKELPCRRAAAESAPCGDPSTHRHHLTRGEAAALTDAGLMPLADYLDLASRHGWSDTDA